MYAKHIPTYARFQWLNNREVFRLLAHFLKPPLKGRKGYDKIWLFRWLLYRQLTECTFRDLESMTGVDYSTFIKFKKRLRESSLLTRIFGALTKLIGATLPSITAIIDSTFLKTYSGHGERGSEYSGYKTNHGFKLHQMIDYHTGLPLLQHATGGARSDIVGGANLMRAAPEEWRLKALLADKAYDGAHFVKDVALKFPGIKVGIPLRRHKPHDSWFNQWMKRRERTLTPSLLNKRSAIERYFSRKKRVFNLGEERTRGFKSFEANSHLVSIAEILEYLARPEAQWHYSPSSGYTG